MEEEEKVAHLITENVLKVPKLIKSCSLGHRNVSQVSCCNQDVIGVLKFFFI